MSSPTKANTWEDRRALFQRGKELHEPARKLSNPKAASPPTSPASTATASSPTTEGSTAQRRRSSASSGGMFGSLMTQKRGSVDYSQRRSSIDEMTAGKSPFGHGGVIDRLVHSNKNSNNK